MGTIFSSGVNIGAEIFNKPEEEVQPENIYNPICLSNRIADNQSTSANFTDTSMIIIFTISMFMV